MRERNDIFGPPGVAKFPRKLRKEFLAALRQFALIELHSDHYRSNAYIMKT